MENKAESSLSAQDERVMAAMAHATIIFPAVGLIGSLIIWGTQKEKSEFLAFQALQAAVYHLLMLLAGLLAGVLYVCSFLGMPITTLLVAPFDEGAALCLPFLPITCVLGILFLGLLAWLAYVGYGIYGALSVLQGRDFRYVFLGPWLERYLEQG